MAQQPFPKVPFSKRYHYSGDNISADFAEDWPKLQAKGWKLRATEDKDEQGAQLYDLVTPQPEKQIMWTLDGSYVRLDDKTLVKNWRHYYAYDPEENEKRAKEITSRYGKQRG